MSVRAGIVVTGTEVLTGRVADLNGPWVADRLLELGVELAHITICGDRAADIEAQLRFLAAEGVDLIVTTGGLGPTADDMTVQTVADFAGRDLVLDTALEAKIAAILKSLMARFTGVDFEAVMAATNAANASLRHQRLCVISRFSQPKSDSILRRALANPSPSLPAAIVDSTTVGHASAAMTLDQYGKLLPGRSEQVADRLDALHRGSA